MYRIAKGFVMLLELVAVVVCSFFIITFPVLVVDLLGSEQYLWLYLLHLITTMYALGGLDNVG